MDADEKKCAGGCGRLAYHNAENGSRSDFCMERDCEGYMGTLERIAEGWNHPPDDKEDSS